MMFWILEKDLEFFFFQELGVVNIGASMLSWFQEKKKLEYVFFGQNSL